MNACRRNRWGYLIGILAVVMLGLASRKYAAMIPGLVSTYAGDTLWALMVYLGVGFVFVKRSANWVALVALTACVSVEISQLYHAVWIDDLRRTRIGGLIMGRDFLWSDLVCYAAGVLAGLSWERRSSFGR